MFDYIIVGAGIAGLSLRNLLNKDANVLILERRSSSMEKSCGGLLAPDAQKVLGKMGSYLPKTVLENPQIFLVRTIDFDNDLERYYKRHYLNLNRLKFESFLKGSNEVAYNTVVHKIVELSDRIEVHTFKNGKKTIYNTKVLIGADGASSKVRKYILGDKDSCPKYVSKQQYFINEAKNPEYLSAFDSSLTDYYGWVTPKNDKVAVGIAIKCNDSVNTKYTIFLEKLRKKGYKLTNPIKTEGALMLRPKKMSHFCIGKKNVYLIGESAGFVSPSSAEGFSYALKSAYYLSEALKINDTFNIYKKKCIKLKIKLILKHHKRPFMYNKLLRQIVMKSNFTCEKLYEK